MTKTKSSPVVDKVARWWTKVARWWTKVARGGNMGTLNGLEYLLHPPGNDTSPP